MLKVDQSMLPYCFSLAVCNFVLQMRNAVKKAMDGCVETLLWDVVVLEPHQNDRSYLRELSGPTSDPLHKNLA